MNGTSTWQQDVRWCRLGLRGVHDHLYRVHPYGQQLADNFGRSAAVSCQSLHAYSKDMLEICMAFLRDKCRGNLPILQCLHDGTMYFDSNERYLATWQIVWLRNAHYHLCRDHHGEHQVARNLGRQEMQAPPR